MLLVFYHSKNVNCIGALSFEISSHIFMNFEVKGTHMGNKGP